MNVVVVLDHPYTLSASENEPHHRAFSAALAKQVIQIAHDRQDSVDVIDLHADGFNPVMSEQDLLNWRTQPFVDDQSQNYFERLKAADLIVFVFPMWWEMMPAMTKGFLDKILAKNQVQKINGRRQLLNPNTKVRVLTVMGTPEIVYRVKYHNPLEKMLKYGVFGKMGIKDFKIINFNAEDQNDQVRQNYLNNLAKKI